MSTLCQTQHPSAVQIFQVIPSKNSAAINYRYQVCVCVCVALEYFEKKNSADINNRYLVCVRARARDVFVLF